jgi:hypothetical protein
MKTSITASALSGMVLALVFGLAMERGACDTVYVYRTESWYNPDTCLYECPAPFLTVVSSNAQGAVACDPAFVTYDDVKSNLGGGAANVVPQCRETGWADSTSTEKLLAQALDKATALDQVYALAKEAWRSGVSAELQRHALAMARSKSKSAADLETWAVMLAALENPSVELERCRQWARGTAEQKKKAADRLSLLLQNPNLVDRIK